MSDDSVSIVLPRQHAQSLYHLLDRAQVQGTAAKRAVVEIMAAVEAALKEVGEHASSSSR